MQPIRRREQLSLNETTSGSRLFECAARVKAAWVEFSENVNAKGVAFLCNFWHQKLPRPEDFKIKKLLVSPQPTYFYITDFVRQHIDFIPQRGMTFGCLLALKFNYRFLLSVFCFKFIYNGLCAFNFRFHSPTWIDFTNLINSSSIETFFFVFFVFSAWDMPSSLPWSRLVTAVLYLCRGTAKPSPCNPLKHSQLKINPRWGMETTCWTHKVRYIKRWLGRN